MEHADDAARKDIAPTPATADRSAVTRTAKVGGPPLPPSRARTRRCRRWSGRSRQRSERRFAFAPSERGIVTVWEDGMWADRRLARELSQKLVTTVVWLLVAPTADAWATRYVNGEEVEREFDETDDYAERAEAFAERERLPQAFRYFADPNIGRLAATLDIPILKELDIDLSTTGSGADEEAAGLLTRTFECGRPPSETR